MLSPEKTTSRSPEEIFKENDGTWVLFLFFVFCFRFLFFLIFFRAENYIGLTGEEPQEARRQREHTPSNRVFRSAPANQHKLRNCPSHTPALTRVWCPVGG